VDVVDHQLDVAGRADEADDQRDRQADAPEDGEADRTFPFGGPEQVLEEVEGEQVQRADGAAEDPDDQDEPHHPRLDAHEVLVEGISPLEPSSPHD
jgi:hypothetical protein